jgi:hypothetical protein
MPVIGSPISTGSSSAYATAAVAVDLASTLPPTVLAGILDPNNASYLDGVLELASDDIDAESIQGRKYDLKQEREFPRVARESGAQAGISQQPISIDTNASFRSAEIWDVDTDGVTVIVPKWVVRATIFQANFRLLPDADRIIRARKAGLASQSTGGMSESYFAPVRPGEWGAGLCADAFNLMRRARRTTGKLL